MFRLSGAIFSGGATLANRPGTSSIVCLLFGLLEGSISYTLQYFHDKVMIGYDDIRGYNR